MTFMFNGVDRLRFSPVSGKQFEHDRMSLPVLCVLFS